MVSVISAGRAMGSTTDQKMRNTPAPSMRAASSTLTGMDSKNCFMMKTPGRVREQRQDQRDIVSYSPTG